MSCTLHKSSGLLSLKLIKRERENKANYVNPSKPKGIPLTLTNISAHLVWIIIWSLSCSISRTSQIAEHKDMATWIKTHDLLGHCKPKNKLRQKNIIWQLTCYFDPFVSVLCHTRSIQQLLEALACTFNVMRMNSLRASLHFHRAVTFNSNKTVSCYRKEK